MTVSETLANLDALNAGLAKLQKSARRTVPMFLLGILATLVAAGVALFYILKLSADLRDARAALERSQTALTEARRSLVDVNQALHEAQKGANNSADAKSIATAISDVSRSQAKIRSASTSISNASSTLTELSSTAISKPAPAPAGTFEVTETGDGFLVLRSEPSMTSTELVRIPVGGVLECGEAIRNVSGNWWRPCRDRDGRSGFVSNTYIRGL